MRHASVLNGALAITLVRSGSLNMLTNIQMLEVTALHRPRVAQYVFIQSKTTDTDTPQANP